MVGFSMAFISSLKIWSTLLSPIPKILTEWDTISSLERLFRYGTALSANIVLHSFGGPGTIITIFPCASKAQPGAVPQVL